MPPSEPSSSNGSLLADFLRCVADPSQEFPGDLEAFHMCVSTARRLGYVGVQSKGQITMTTSSLDRAILQHVARRSGEDTDSRDGWCRWSTSDRWLWDWADYKPLVARGLLERRETWKDVLLKLTDAGWAYLAEGNE